MSDLFNNQGNSGDKRTLIAVVLSVIVITAGFMIQNWLFPPAPVTVPQATAPAAPVAGGASAEAGAAFTQAPAEAAPLPESLAAFLAAAPRPLSEKRYTVETDLLVATFTNKGGDLLSLKLKKHKDRSGNVDLIVPAAKVDGLSVAFGDTGAAPYAGLMNARFLDDYTIEFSAREALGPEGRKAPLTYRKVFSFRNGEYLFGMAVSLENAANEFIPLDSNGSAYTVALGPQIGPDFSYLPKNADYRKIITLVEGKKKNENPKGTSWSPKAQPTWSAIAGKYFAFVAVPELQSYQTRYLMTQAGPAQESGMSLSRPVIRSSKQTDTYYFYFGPKTAAELGKYEYADRNGFGKAGLGLESVMDSSGILSWLEIALKFMMNLFYRIIPNYGVSIILVTLLVKVVLYPLSKKGSVATARMSELQPKIQELQTKYKSNPQKMNQELAELYKVEGYNPMSGCLPLLIQFPLFIAMYNLFNNHFDLRGASFIPGWIPDLSMPESVLSFGDFRVPILGWNDLRALPIVYLVSQLLYGKFTQTPQTGPNAAQMKFMMYGMPIMFFFILYDVPSGLLIYWIASNVLQIGQQIIINDHIKKHKEARAASGPKLVPKKK